jgi:hypothetical protein
METAGVVDSADIRGKSKPGAGLAVNCAVWVAGESARTGSKSICRSFSYHLFIFIFLFRQGFGDFPDEKD